VNYIKEVSRDLKVRPGLIITALYVGNRADDYTLKEIPKRNGNTRTIHAVNGRLRTLQKKAHEWLSNMYSPKAVAKGFVIGGGIIENAKIHRNKKLVVCYDLKDFFPSITFARVRGMFMSYPFNFSTQKATCFAQICCLPEENGSIPQGGITSPFVSNMICRRLDERLQGLAIKKRMKYSRYADDLTFSTDDNVDYEKLTKIVSEIVFEEGFVLNVEKSRILTKSNRQVVTGIVVNEGLNVNRKYIRSLRALLHNCYQKGVLSQIARKANYSHKPWNSCPPLGRNENGEYFLYKNGDPIKIKDAKYKYMEHLFGRIQFIGQVAKSNEGLNQNHYKKRKEIYDKLLGMWENVRINEGITGSIKAQAHKILYEQQDEELLEAIKEFTVEELNDFVAERKKIDPRYFTYSFSVGTTNIYRNQVLNFAKYPKPNNKKVIDYLNQLKDSENRVLGRLVHKDKIVSKKKFIEFRKQFEQDKYYFPKLFRDFVDDFVNKDIKIFLEKNDDNTDTFSDETFVTTKIHKFKKNTRFSNNIGTNVQPDETDLVKLIKTEFARATKSKEIKWDLEKLDSFGFYTLVSSVRYAIKEIVESMFDNSLGTIIKCRVVKEYNGIEIYDNNTNPIDILPNRNFLHGKLKSAVFHLTALCDYSIIANFSEGGWKNINMMKEEVNDSEEYSGFTHKLTFKKLS